MKCTAYLGIADSYMKWRWQAIYIVPETRSSAKSAYTHGIGPWNGTKWRHGWTDHVSCAFLAICAMEV